MIQQCKVRWIRNLYGEADAVLFDNKGRSINAINYPRGHKVTAAEKRRAERVLLASFASCRRKKSRKG